MAEYIEKAALLKAMVTSDEIENLFQAGIAAAKAIVNSAPVADVAPVVHGRWEESVIIRGHELIDGYKCSLCGREELQKEPYCNCGAIMSLED